MSTDRTILGVDVGAVSVSLVELGRDGRERSAEYAFHHGRVRACLEQLLTRLEPGRVGWLCCTRSATPWLREVEAFDDRVAHVAAARHRHGRIGALLLLGGERFSLLRFDGQG